MQKHEIINSFFARYQSFGASYKGIKELVNRAFNRGYDANMICFGLETVMKKKL
ncbi:MAG: hypothetical protein KH452_06090 [Clostridiales bacterium]|nr:hypothetical protein [Clostridiales bacterium]